MNVQIIRCFTLNSNYKNKRLLIQHLFLGNITVDFEHVHVLVR